MVVNKRLLCLQSHLTSSNTLADSHSGALKYLYVLLIHLNLIYSKCQLY